MTEVFGWVLAAVATAVVVVSPFVPTRPAGPTARPAVVGFAASQEEVR